MHKARQARSKAPSSTSWGWSWWSSTSASLGLSRRWPASSSSSAASSLTSTITFVRPPSSAPTSVPFPPRRKLLAAECPRPPLWQLPEPHLIVHVHNTSASAPLPNYKPQLDLTASQDVSSHTTSTSTFFCFQFIDPAKCVDLIYKTGEKQSIVSSTPTC
jgi:hypothetical protein